MMLDEFPALGRLDFFETALAFMAGYGIRAYLIAQSLNQISKAYGENNSILDNCHVRIAFSSNDERTAKRISDALGTATELRAQRNYAGHRLSPWLSHVMVSKQETRVRSLTPGEVMQLPPRTNSCWSRVLAPIRAKKLRYYDDRNFTVRVLASRPRRWPLLGSAKTSPDDWSGQVRGQHGELASSSIPEQGDSGGTMKAALQATRTQDSPRQNWIRKTSRIAHRSWPEDFDRRRLRRRSQQLTALRQVGELRGLAAHGNERRRPSQTTTILPHV